MQSNSRVVEPLGEDSKTVINGSLSRSGTLEKAEVIIEHRALPGEPITNVQDLLSPRDNAKRDHIAWAFFKACAIGLAVSMVFISFLAGSDGQTSITSRLFVNLASGLVMMILAPFLIIPVRILCDVCRFFSIKRGLSDVLIGALFGSTMMVFNMAISNPTLTTSFGFILGGTIGGFAYWRYRGYPQTGDQQEMSGEPSAAVQRF